MASRGHALLALTIPETSYTVLAMGRCVLRTHRAGTSSYHPNGHWGIRRDSDLVLPVTDERTVNELRRVFQLSALMNLVFHHRAVIRDDLTADGFTSAVAAEYFLPILRGELTVRVDHNGAAETIDATRLASIADSLSLR